MVLTRENWNRWRERFVDVIEVQRRFDVAGMIPRTDVYGCAEPEEVLK